MTTRYTGSRRRPRSRSRRLRFPWLRLARNSAALELMREWSSAARKRLAVFWELATADDPDPGIPPREEGSYPYNPSDQVWLPRTKPWAPEDTDIVKAVALWHPPSSGCRTATARHSPSTAGLPATTRALNAGIRAACGSPPAERS